MNKVYCVERSLVITVYDYIVAESEEDATKKIDELKSIAAEISQAGLSANHASVSYTEYDENHKIVGNSLE